MPSILLLLLSYAGYAAEALPDGSQAPAHTLKTRWAETVTPENVWPEYPRPQLQRRDWLNLNGLWDYAITDAQSAIVTAWDGRILVPFPVESALSGVTRRLEPEHALWYRRSFAIPEAWSGRRVLLHFGAVDWEAQVFVNGALAASHRGGYDPFSCDVTEHLRPGGENELRVRAWDPTDAGTQPRGKQVRKPEGIWYTPSSGIWQTVWLEPVHASHLRALTVTPRLASAAVEIGVEYWQTSGRWRLEYQVLADGAPVHGSQAQARVVRAHPEVVRERTTLRIRRPRPWSPDDPFLYGLRLRLYHDDVLVDEVESYFGLREIALGRDRRGATRLLLNQEPLFQIGTLDQGFWPDGLYTPPSEAALRYDLEMLKDLGFNMLRKHVKVECARYYYWCDKLGLLVWQDMPSGDGYIGSDDPDLQRTPESARQFESEWRAIIDALRHHPSVVMWVPFNEGWGQYDSARIAALTREHDPTRLVDHASGWADRGAGDVIDWHVYPGPALPPREPQRAAVLGEFGGLGLPLAGHTWLDQGTWGYRSYATAEELTAAYLQLMERLRPLIDRGLSAAVYTQTSDVESEVNGLLTYDRARLKLDAAAVHAAHHALFLPPPFQRWLLPAADTNPQNWRYATAPPGAGWEQPGFADADWPLGRGGFGTEGTPGARVHTRWDGGAIWLRQDFALSAVPDALQLWLHHDEDAEIYLNGVLAARRSGYTTDYEALPIAPSALAALRRGRNTIAIHCRQTTGGQYIDAGLVQRIEAR